MSRFKSKVDGVFMTKVTQTKDLGGLDSYTGEAAKPLARLWTSNSLYYMRDVVESGRKFMPVFKQTMIIIGDYLLRYDGILSSSVVFRYRVLFYR